MKHPADMTPAQKAVYEHGYSHFDTLFRMGYTAEDTTLYIQGLRARMDDEQYRALHPGLFTERREA